MEGNVGGGVLQPGHGFHGQAAAQGHVRQIGEHAQLPAGLVHLIIGHGAEIEGGGGQGDILPEQGHTVVKSQVGVGGEKFVNLLRGQIHRGQGDGGEGGQVLQVFKQTVVGKAARLQNHRGTFAGDSGTAQVHGVGHVHLWMFLDVFENGGIAGAAGKVNGFQVGVLVQGIDFAR